MNHPTVFVTGRTCSKHKSTRSILTANETGRYNTYSSVRSKSVYGFSFPFCPGGGAELFVVQLTVLLRRCRRNRQCERFGRQTVKLSINKSSSVSFSRRTTCPVRRSRFVEHWLKLWVQPYEKPSVLSMVVWKRNAHRRDSCSHQFARTCTGRRDIANRCTRGELAPVANGRVFNGCAAGYEVCRSGREIYAVQIDA
jgi:hypothetical protein